MDVIIVEIRKEQGHGLVQNRLGDLEAGFLVLHQYQVINAGRCDPMGYSLPHRIYLISIENLSISLDIYNWRELTEWGYVALCQRIHTICASDNR